MVISVVSNDLVITIHGIHPYINVYHIFHGMSWYVIFYDSTIHYQ